MKNRLSICCCFLSDFVLDPPQYIPLGDMDTENSALVERGYNRESVRIHALAWNFLSTALKSKSDKSILHRCTSPREAWDALLAWYGPQTTGAKPDLSRRLNSFKRAPGSNPLEEMGKIEDVAAEMRSAGMTLDDHMLCTIFIDALPAEYEVEARNLASRDSIGRMTSPWLYESGITNFLERGPLLAMPAMLCRRRR